MAVRVAKVDYSDPKEADHFRDLLNAYACDRFGAGEALPQDVLDALPVRLAEFPTAFSVIAYVDDEPAALANCFFGFSTFAARRLVNIHDVVVLDKFRGQGLSRKLFESVEQIARDSDCCKLTLEVLEHNDIALAAYRRFGFDNYELDPTAGRALFMDKKLT
ncbi:MAG: GNAT family N-acetyltransferase [Planctomycetaceae bacterium]